MVLDSLFQILSFLKQNKNRIFSCTKTEITLPFKTSGSTNDKWQLIVSHKMMKQEEKPAPALLRKETICNSYSLRINFVPHHKTDQIEEMRKHTHKHPHRHGQTNRQKDRHFLLVKWSRNIRIICSSSFLFHLSPFEAYLSATLRTKKKHRHTSKQNTTTWQDHEWGAGEKRWDAIEEYGLWCLYPCICAAVSVCVCGFNTSELLFVHLFS